MYKSILLKLSGEALGNDLECFDKEKITKISNQIKELNNLGIKVAIVVGGGNFVRGKTLENSDFKRETADTIGMLGTVMNALALESVLRKLGVEANAYSSLEMPQVIKPFRQKEVEDDFNNKVVLIFAAGVGHPYFSTDTGCALRASQLKVDAILIAKNGVDGVYSDDPLKNKNAFKYNELTYRDLLVKNLKVIDATASSLLSENNIEAYVFDMNQERSIVKIIENQNIGTKIKVKE